LGTTPEVKTSISNLAWDRKNSPEIISMLGEMGIDGIEIAPTKIWEDLEHLKVQERKVFLELLANNGLRVSGIQSLSFGHPEFQIFDRSTWPKFIAHLRKIITLGGHLEADFAVFGSPKNRLKGRIGLEEANTVAIDFFSQLIPDLQECNIKLTLEPNAVEYGADYLTNYCDVVHLSEAINSPWIVPQIDTGCMWMSGENVENSFNYFRPAHVHLSNPNLEQLPGESDFLPFLNLMKSTNYEGWVVVEMLLKSGNDVEDIRATATWLLETLKIASKEA
jgi:D-psicose/D-tagatose/L-ribulose 3-epimerase